MLQITFKPSESFKLKVLGFTPELKKSISKILSGLIFDIFPAAKSHQFAINDVSGDVDVMVKGVYPCGQIESQTYAQIISNKLREIKFRNFYSLSGVTTRAEVHDMLVGPNLIGFTPYARLMKEIFSIEDKEIPARFICPILNEIMDVPAYLVSNPKVNYERDALSKWVMERSTDPTTREKICEVGIVENKELQQEIFSFLSDRAEEKDTSKYHETSKEIALQTEGDFIFLNRNPATMFSNSNSSQASASSKPTSLETLFSSANLKSEFLLVAGKALRRFANAGRCGDVTAALSLCGDPQVLIDQQDDNPNSRQTALHYAIKGTHKNVISLLLTCGASTEILNAQNKSAKMLMLESTDPEIKALVPAEKSETLSACKM